jgi:hypothetical protein
VLAALAIVLLPDTAFAWTPATHIYLGQTVLANLAQLPGQVVDLLRVYPYDFLYGNIAADTSMAKKYAPVGRHCHAWHVGQEIYDLAETDALRSFALGYLSHLAADAVAHNFFVPRQLVVTSSAIGLGHSYWESRFETHLGDKYARTAMDLIRLDHSTSDGHLDRIISPTIFSVRTNRRLFRGMVRVAETQSWQRAFRIVAQNSRWDLTDDEVERHMATSFHLVMEMLRAAEGTARRLDPSGEASLRLAKRLRRRFLREEPETSGTRLLQVADEHFGLPSYELTFWDSAASLRPWRGER